LKRSPTSETIREKEELMSKLLERLESKLGRRCPECGLKEWKSHFKIHEVRHWAQGTQWWDAQEYRIVEYTHLTCGHTWTTQQDIFRPAAYIGD
jgi:hypothetical protein